MRLRRSVAFAGLSLVVSCGAPRPPSAPAGVSVTIPAAQPAEARTLPPRQTPDAPFRAEAPALPPPEAFAPPPIQTFRLSNGVRVVFLERHVPALLRVQLVLKAGAAPLGAGAMAVRDAWLGTSLHSQGQLSAARDAELSQTWGWEESGTMAVGIMGFADRADFIVDFLAEAALKATYPADAVLRETIMAMHEREAQDGVPRTIAARVLPMALYGLDRPEDDIAIARSSDIGALRRDDVAQAHDVAFDPSGATLTVAGDATVQTLRPRLERAFGGWKHISGHGPAKAAPPSKLAPSPRLVVVDRPQSPESYVLLGGPGPALGSGDWAPATVMNEIFGGATGRATRTLVGDRHLAWGVASRLGTRRFDPRFQWSAEFSAQRTGEGLREVVSQMRAMVDADVSAVELEDARTRLVRTDPIWLATVEGEQGILNALAVYDLPADYPSKTAARLRVVTAADVRRVAKSYLDPDHMKIVVVGDWSKIRGPLEELGWGAIEVRDASGAVVRTEPAPVR